MDYLSIIRKPIEAEMDDFVRLFNDSLAHETGLLDQVLTHIRQRGGKRMRPLLLMLTAKNYGAISDVSLNAALGLELLHTASLVHDDVVDESAERRGQASVNASYNNKVAVLVGDYILSTALLRVSLSDNQRIVQQLARLGQILAAGEVLQLSNISNQEISEDVYYQVINKKTAALFEACSVLGAISVGASEDDIEKARKFGHNVGMIFQIRDDIFDYFPSPQIGKPSGNDMLEGKLTLPAIHCVLEANDPDITALAMRVKQHNASQHDIRQLVNFTLDNGGIEYAEQQMHRLHADAMKYINERVGQSDINQALTAYLNYCIQRNI